MLIGAHVSPAGGLYKAVERGNELGAESIQIFNQSPRMWRPTNYGEDDFARFREAREASHIAAVLIHAVYLLNCASEDPEIREKSLAGSETRSVPPAWFYTQVPQRPVTSVKLSPAPES
jgi:deoxyribonuclease IV